MKKILIFITTFLFFGITQTFAANWDTGVAEGGNAHLDKKSGVTGSSYTVKWCAAHKPGLPWYSEPLDSTGCYEGKINKRSGDALLDPKGVLTSGKLDEFLDGMGFKFAHEGELTLNSYVMDKANNVSIESFVYKIDKTAPQFLPVTYSETSPYAYALEQSSQTPDVQIKHAAQVNDIEYPHINVYGYDNNDDPLVTTVKYADLRVCPTGYSWSSWSRYTRCSKGYNVSNPICPAPLIGNAGTTETAIAITKTPVPLNQKLIYRNQYIQGEGGANPKNIDQCIEWVSPISPSKVLTKVRFKQDNVPAGEYPKITIDLSATSDHYGNKRSSQISGIEKLVLYKGLTLETASIEKEFLNPGTSVEFEAKMFNVSKDSFEIIRLRMYDNAGNFAEQAFELYRDETAPVANKIHINFEDDVPGEFMPQNVLKYSHFIPANTSTKIKYNWNPFSIDQNNHMASTMTVRVEKHDNPAAKDASKVMSNLNGIAEVSGTTNGFNLSKVDNDFFSPTSNKYNFRYYGVEFNTPGITGNKICDEAGNCIDGVDVLSFMRVIAGPINKDQSTIGIEKPTKAIANNPANLPDQYTVNYTLKDQYGNSVRQVTSRLSATGEVKTVSTDMNYINGLTDSQTAYSTSKNTTAVEVIGSEVVTNNINANTPQVSLKELHSDSNGNFSYTISSKLPTVGGYKYMKNTANLILDNITNNISHKDAVVHNPENQIQSISFSGSKVTAINNVIHENSNNRFNVTDTLANYGEVLLPLNYDKSLAFSESKTLNFEFGSPFIYHAENFNILRDGINSKHTKKLDTKTGISTYALIEKYFDVNDKNSNSNANFYLNNSIIDFTNDLGFKNQAKGTINEKEFNVRYDALLNRNFKKWGYVSYLKYNAGGGQIFIPSISRGIMSASGSASAYYPTVVSGTGTSFLTEDIAISGLVNEIEGGANQTVKPGQVSLDMKRPYTRAELLQKVKRKMFSISRGLDWCEPSSDINVNNPDPDCTTTINGEEITFYNGPITIPAASINDRRAIIVKDGRVSITGDLTTNTNGQLLIVSVTEKGLSNIKINSSDNNTKPELQKGWITIHEDVTNIDAFLLAQGPLVTSFTTGNYIFKDYRKDNNLLNQLHIYGSVFSLNTIGGSKTGECPYIEESCLDGDTAKIYDLSFLRRYTRVDAGNFGGNNGSFVPYDPNLQLDKIQSLKTASKSSGGLQYYGDGTAVGSPTLRVAKTEHENAPVIVERDNRWTTTPSFFAKD